ncbi:MAG: hypothetical protein GX595_04080 [Lentisphaerae bacterium]|nr:hypothetical protein [Lentisphaerota bacterium]
MAAEGLVPPEQSEAWERQLREALATADGTDPGTTWEALDYLQEAVGERAGEALRQAQEWNAAMQQAETALATMAALTRREALSAAEEARLLEALDGMLHDAAEAAGKALPSDLQEALAKALEEAAAGRLTPEQRRRLAELLSQCRGAEALTPEQLARLRQLSPEEVEALLEAMASCAGADPEALAAALAALEAGSCSAEAILAACAGAGPGTGGVARGPGAAALTWSAPPAPLTAPLAPAALPPGSRLDLEHTRLQGVSYAAPEERTGAGPTAGVLTAGGGATGARESTLLPRHRAAVEAYFGRRARTPAPPGGGP